MGNPFSDLTGSSLQFYFRKPTEFDDDHIATVSCEVHLAVPAGSLPTNGFDVRVSRTCTAEKPLNSLRIFKGSVQGDRSPDPTSVQFTGLPFTDSNGNVVSYAGIIWKGDVTTPLKFKDVYGSDGMWNYTQVVTPSRVFQGPGGPYNLVHNGEKVLDTWFPYAHRWYPADGSEGANGDSPKEGLGSSTASGQVLDSFLTYTFYLPPGDGSVCVPLKGWDWYWQFHAVKDSSGMWNLSNTNADWGFLDDFPEHPIWTANVAPITYSPLIP